MDGSTTATESQNRQQRRRRGAAAETVYVVAAHTISRRGLPWSLYYGTCPGCRERRAFTQAGERVCACGARLLLVVGMEVA